MADNIVSVTGTFTGTGSSTTVSLRNKFNLSLWGTFVATLQLQRSFDGGSNWLPVTDSYGTAMSWTAPASLSGEEPEIGVLYRVTCTAFTSGTVNYRLSQ